MAHPIEGKTFCVTGSLRWYDAHTFTELVEERGGRVTSGITHQTDFLVHGEEPDGLLDEAVERDVRVIDEDQFKALLRGDPLALAEDDAPMTSAYREVEPDASTWARIVRHVHDCAPEHLDALVEDLGDWISRWSVTPRDVPHTALGRLSARADPAWVAALPHDELRCAPFTWVQEMARGEDSSKYALARAVHLQGMRLSKSELGKVASRPDLTNLRMLGVDDAATSKTFWKKLLSGNLGRRLEHLRLSRIDAAVLSGLEPSGPLGRLVELTLRDPRVTTPGLLARLFELPVFENVEALNVEVDGLHEVLSALDSSAALPNLEAITLRIPGRIDQGLLSHEVCARVGRVRVSWFIELNRSSTTMLGDDLEALTHGAIGPRHLDLSGLEITRQSIRNPLALEPIHRVFSEWKPPTCIARITLGRWWSDALSEAYDALSIRAMR